MNSLGGQGVLIYIVVEMRIKTYIQVSVNLVMDKLAGFIQDIHNMGLCNFPPCLRNQLLSEVTQLALGVVTVLYLLKKNLQYINLGGGWIFILGLTKRLVQELD